MRISVGWNCTGVIYRWVILQWKIFRWGQFPSVGIVRGAIVQRVIIWGSHVRGATTVGGVVLEPFTDI